MDLTFQVPMQYCSLQHWAFLPSPVTSTMGHCCYFGSASSFFLELFLHSSIVAYWSPTNLGNSSFSDISLLFLLFMRWFVISFSSGPHFVKTLQHHPSILCGPTYHGSWFHWVKTRLWSKWSAWLVFCNSGFHSDCPLMDEDKKLVKVSWWEG